MLVKLALEEIPLYWVSLTFISKGVLDMTRKLCFKFLWVGSNEKKIFHWVSSKKIVPPKEMGGLGIKNIHCFSKSLETKYIW